MARTTIRTEDITASAVTSAKIAAGAVDTTGLEDDIALLGFRVASNGSLAKYNLVDQIVDDFQDTSGVDASASTNEIRDSSGKYYGGSSEASGGTKTTYSSGGSDYVVHKFSDDDDFIAAASGDADILLIAGGGAGGSTEGGGGGGAGGFKYFPQRTLSAATYSAVIGVGGTGVTATTGVSGGNSTFDSQTATGGGGGGKGDGSNQSGAVGGSGGGGGGRETTAGAAGTANQGNAGGASSTAGDSPAQDQGGGGGGAGAVGQSCPDADNAGNGGNGYTEGNTVYDWEADSGTVTFPAAFYNGLTNSSYAGGGGGGCTPTGSSGAGNNGDGGTGGGGAGGSGSGAGGNGTAGTANTGGGGGGSSKSTASADGADGGTGVVIIRYVSGQFATFNNMTLVSTTTAAKTGLVPSKGDIVLTYTNGAGTTTLDTDLTAEISADGGSTWTPLPLASEGSTGSHNIATSHDVTISTTITEPYNMAYRIKTLNQAVGKTTRIQAVSLGWS